MYWLKMREKLLAPLDADQIHYLGRPIKKSYLDPPFNALDSTIILSRGAISYLTDNFYTNLSVCNDKVFKLKDTGHLSNQTIRISRNFDATLGYYLAQKVLMETPTR